MDSSIQKILAQYQALSDEQLLEDHARKGDCTPLHILIGRYQALVFGYCLKHLRHRESARDLAMLILERILRNAPRTEIRYFKSWLMTVIRHELRDAQRQLKRELYTFKDLDEALAADPGVAYEATPLHVVEEREDMLRRAVAELREDQRICLELFYFEEKSYKEITQLTAYSLGEVKSSLQNGKRNLLIKLQSDPRFKDGY